MATFVWTGATNTTWSTGSNWKVAGVAQSNPPTSADDVAIGNGTGATNNAITLTANTTVRSVNCTSYTGTFTHNTNIILSIGDGTAGASNIALKFVAGMTYTRNTGSGISFVSTSSTAQDVDFASKGGGIVLFSGVGGSWKLTGTVLEPATGTFTLTSGALDLNGQTCTFGTFSFTGTLTRSLTLGAATIVCAAAGTAWNATTVTGLTFTGNTASITLSGAGATFQGGGLTYTNNNVSLTGSGTAALSSSGSTFNNVTRTGTAIKTDAFNMAQNFTVGGALLITGQSDINRMLVNSGTVGTTRTVTVNGSHGANANVNFRDITITGSAGTLTGTSLGDSLGNTNITFDAAVPQTWNGNTTGNVSTAANWTSRVPLPQDNVLINGLTSGTITMDMPQFGFDIDCTGSTGGTLTNSITVQNHGGLKLASGMTFGGAGVWQPIGRGTHDITTNGVQIGKSVSVIAPGATYTLRDDLYITATLVWNGGSFDANGFNVRFTTFTCSSPTVASNIFGGEGIWTVAGTGTVWNSNSNACNVGMETATIVISDTSTTSKTFSMSSNNQTTRRLYNLTVEAGDGTVTINAGNALTTTNAFIDGKLWIKGGRAGSIIMNGPTSTGTTIINDIEVEPNKLVTWTAARNFRFTNRPTWTGVNNGYLALPGIAGNYLSAPDSAALDITGNIDIRVKANLNDWSRGTAQIFASKLHNAGQFSYDLWINGAGNLVLRTSPDGTTLRTNTSTAAVAFADGATGWVRGTKNTATGVVKLYTSTDSTNDPSAVTWTQLGTDVAGTVEATFSGTDVMELGADIGGTLSVLAGRLYRAQIRNNILDDGTGIQFDADLTTKAFGANTFTESSSNAATVTINGTAAQTGDGRVDFRSSTPGTAYNFAKPDGGYVSADYMSLTDSAATGNFYAGTHSINVSGNTGWHFNADNPMGFFLLF